MDADELRRRMDALKRSDGDWTAHDIALAPGLQTIGSALEDARVRRIVQVAADIAGKPLDQLRVLDLGSLEGQFAIEFALHGAEVVAVEARETNIRKTRFAAEALSIERLDLRMADVRALNTRDYGSFDIVLCLGLLYHLDAPDVMELVRSMSDVCRRALIIDTHFSLAPRTTVEWQGHRYWGDFWTEYAIGTRAEQEDKALWSSIGNDHSFLLTRASLSNLLRHTGFTSAYECLNPYESHSPDWPEPPRDGRVAEWPDRATFIAIKGQRETLFTSPTTDACEERDRPERPKHLQPIRPPTHPAIAPLRRLVSRLRRRLLG
jgi:SAM-dependent methyltransferase